MNPTMSREFAYFSRLAAGATEYTIVRRRCACHAHCKLQHVLDIRVYREMSK